MKNKSTPAQIEVYTNSTHFNFDNGLQVRAFFRNGMATCQTYQYEGGIYRCFCSIGKIEQFGADAFADHLSEVSRRKP